MSERPSAEDLKAYLRRLQELMTAERSMYFECPKYLVTSLIVELDGVYIDHADTKKQLTQLTLERDQLKEQNAFNEAFAEKLRDFGTVDRLVEEYSAYKMKYRELALERDQLREQCAYNQLTIEALTAKLAKADRMDQ